MFLFKLYCQAKLFYNSNELLWDKVSGLCIDFESDLYINEIFFCFSSNLNKVVPNGSTCHLDWEMGATATIYIFFFVQKILLLGNKKINHRTISWKHIRCFSRILKRPAMFRYCSFRNCKPIEGGMIHWCMIPLPSYMQGGGGSEYGKNPFF